MPLLENVTDTFPPIIDAVGDAHIALLDETIRMRGVASRPKKQAAPSPDTNPVPTSVTKVPPVPDLGSAVTTDCGAL